MSGWIFWHWDPLPPEYVYITPRWTATDSGDRINGVLEPAYRPDACTPGRIPTLNLARNLPTVSASKTWSETTVAMAFDGNLNTRWIADGVPPQWIEMDFGSSVPLGKISLVIEQSWDAIESQHRVWGRNRASDSPQLLHEFKQVTVDGQRLEWDFPPTGNSWRYVRVETLAPTNHWVAWKEISVWSSGPDQYKPILSQAGSIVNAASLQAGVSPGAWMSIFGSNLAGSTRSWTGADFAGSQLPTKLDGVSVLVNGKPAAIGYISPTQLNVQVPDTGGVTGNVDVQVFRVDVAGERTPVRIQSAAPGFFTYPVGNVNYLAAVHPDGTTVGDSDKVAGVRPLRAEQRCLLFGTGFGASPAGKLIPSPVPTPSPVEVRVGGKLATVEYAGVIAPGLVQINLIVPDLPAGDYTVIATVEGVTTQEAVVIPIR